MLSYVFLTVLDPAARFISVTLHVDKSLKMAPKRGDCRKIGKFTELYSFVENVFCNTKLTHKRSPKTGLMLTPFSLF